MSTIEAYGNHYNEVPAIIDQSRVTPEYYDLMVGASALGQAQFTLELSEFRGPSTFMPREALPSILRPRSAFSENLEGYAGAKYASDTDVESGKPVLGGLLFSVMPGLAKELTIVEDVLLLPRFVPNRLRSRLEPASPEIHIYVVRDPQVQEVGWPKDPPSTA